MDKENAVHIHNGILLGHEKNEINYCRNIDGPRDDDIKWSKPDKGRYHMISLICGIYKNYGDKFIYKTETDSQI